MPAGWRFGIILGQQPSHLSGVSEHQCEHPPSPVLLSSVLTPLIASSLLLLGRNPHPFSRSHGPGGSCIPWLPSTTSSSRRLLYLPHHPIPASRSVRNRVTVHAWGLEEGWMNRHHRGCAAGEEQICHGLAWCSARLPAGHPCQLQQRT